MGIGGGFKRREASGCWPNEARRSKGILRTSSIRGLDRLYVRGRENVHKKLLLHAAACNLALLLRRLHGSGKPKAASDRKIEVIFALLRFMDVLAANSIRP
jgi:hypothetical protein